MADAILVLNAGSSSLKFCVFLGAERSEPLFRGQVEGLLTRPHFTVRDSAGATVAEETWAEGTRLGHPGAIECLLAWGRAGALEGHRIVAAGHRIVHGGVRFTGPVRIDAEVLAELERLIPLAPLHQPHNLAAVRAVAGHAPQLPQVAAFDTSFHRAAPPVSQLFALPRRFTVEGVRRYGFHGLSFEHVARVLPGLDAGAAAGRTVVAHLGNGASMCAMAGGRSIAATMGFSTADGLPMGTRCGALDPGAILYLMDRHGMDARSLERLLYEESGLLGVSGISSDMRVLLESRDPRAAEAIDLFVYHIGRELGSLAAALNGLDALVFTGGIGENAASIRDRVCRDAAWLGLDLDAAANQRGGPRISHAGSRVSAWVVAANEELVIARHTGRLLAAAPRQRSTAT